MRLLFLFFINLYLGYSLTQNYERIKACDKYYPSPDPVLALTTTAVYGNNGFIAKISNPISHFHVYYPNANNLNVLHHTEYSYLHPNISSSLIGAEHNITYPTQYCNNSMPCSDYIKTSEGCKEHSCIYGVNAGPFSFTPSKSCLGNIVSDGNYVKIDTSTEYESFGLTKDGYWILGKLSEQDIDNFSFVQLVTGFHWLVRNGSIIPQTSELIAPRTAIGVDNEGVLYIIEVDGIEFEFKGLKLQQLATYIAETLKIPYAINLDGGGSSVTYFKGKVISYPTCHDTSEKCERPIVTYICIK